VEDKIIYTLWDQLIPEASNCNKLGIILRSELSWDDHVKLTVIKAWKAIRFKMRAPEKGKSCTKRLAHTTPVGSIPENGVACLDPYREGQIHGLDRVQKKAAKFAHHTNESTGKLCRSVQRYHVYVFSSKLTLENGCGRLYVTDYNGATI